ncbi:hypothetical protein [Acidovorax sp. FG27]|uniref:hypothetical protein n=1 Tax=Acidovorax sp. FG27 TaxID=3133652 RepID=UPI003341C6F8
MRLASLMTFFPRASSSPALAPSFPASRLALLVLIAGWLLAGYGVVPRLPASAGWENSWLENIQVLFLLGGAAAAAWFARRLVREGRARPAIVLAACLVPVWLVLAGRELAWGAAFLAPMDIEEGEPIYSSSVLAYKFAVAPVVGAAAAGVVALLLRYRADRLIWPHLSTGRFPWAEVALGLCAALMSTYAEGHLGLPVSAAWQQSAPVLEEWVEVAAYLALWGAQQQLFRILQHGRR